MASPQVENGFTRIANELLEALMTADLNGTQFRIMLAVIRESYGRQNRSVDLSYSRIAELVNQPRTVVGRNLKQLIARNFLRHSGGELSTWSVQKDYSQWLGSDQLVTSHQTVTSDQTVPKSSDQTVTRGSDQLVTQLKKEERKKESGGVEQTNGRAAAGSQVLSAEQQQAVERLMSKTGCHLDRTSATKYALNHAFVPDELDSLDTWSGVKRKQGKNPAAILIARYVPHGDLPDDLPEVKARTSRLTTAEINELLRTNPGRYDQLMRGF